MKAKQTRTKVILEMAYAEAAAVLELIESGARRRREEFNRTSIMNCWGCRGTELDLIESLGKQARVIAKCRADN